jgi:PAS domain S-box-containing protein
MAVNFQHNLVGTVTNRCQKLLDRLPSIAWLMTDQGEIIAVNEQWYKYVEKHNLTQPTQITELLHSADLEPFLLAWTEAKERHDCLTKRFRLKSISEDGEWFQIETEPDLDEFGQVTWIGTAMRLGSQAVFPNQYQSTQFLEALLDYASDGIVACDASGQLVLFNRAAQSFHGLPPEPIDPEEWADYYDLYDSDGLNILTKSEIPLFQALEEKIVISQEMMIKSKQGKDRSLLASGAAIYSTTGEKLGAVVLMRDITEYKRAMTDRYRAEYHSERLSTVLKVAKTGAWIWDFSNHQIFWTREFEMLFDYEPGSTQQIYSEWLERLHPEDRERAETALQNTIDHKLPTYRCEYRVICRDGQIRWIDAIGDLHYDDQGNPQMSGLVHDITERKQLELLSQKQTADLQNLNSSLVLTQQQLKERNEELDSFVHMVSHDLKAPLRAIANLSTWIEEELDDQIAEENQQHFLLLRQRIHRMDALIDGLLRYSQVGRRALESEIVDVAQLLSELIDSLSPPENFKIEFLSPLPTLTTKRILLSQVFANLLSNAIKHHDRADGRVEISVEDLGDRYKFSIADDGLGIPAGKDRERIFEIFHTLKPDSTGTNTGIGLAVVKKIVEGEGGQIWLDDQLNQGTCFHFTWIHNSN